MTSILILDDSLTVRMDLVEAVEAAGLRAVPCSTIAEARAALAADHIALALLDVRLPDGDGIDLLQEIRATPRLAELPVVMLSSEAEVKDRVRGLRTGATDYVGKPYDTEVVLTRIMQLVGAQQPADGAATATGAPRGTVLVIDDSATFRNELRDALVTAGYTAILAASGPEGLRLAALHRPDAVVVDGMMPGMDGATVLRRIRLDPGLRTTPCVLLTAADDADAELRALDAGADAFVRKEADADTELILVRLFAVLRGASRHAPEPSLLAPRRILAVDDSPTYLHALADALRAEGYDVVTATSGEEAIELLAVQPVDCILLDRVMPGLDGSETCRRIKAAPVIRDTPLVMLTSLDDRGSMIDGLAAGADDFITKSSGIEVLKARVQAQIRRKQIEDEHRRIRDKLLLSERVATEERAHRQLAEDRAKFTDELERKNRELEAFSYSVSHDLRAPLRAINGFSRALLDDFAPDLPPRAVDYLNRVRVSAVRMGELIEDLMALSKIGRAELHPQRVDVGDIASEVASELARREPGRAVELTVRHGLEVEADPRLLRVLLENLLGNAWKFTSKTPDAHVEIMRRDGRIACVVRDNGAGFDSGQAGRLFLPFQRLHDDREFAGSGVGLATVQRIVDCHGGRVWAEGEVGHGAAFWFTLPRAA